MPSVCRVMPVGRAAARNLSWTSRFPSSRLSSRSTTPVYEASSCCNFIGHLFQFDGVVPGEPDLNVFAGRSPAHDFPLDGVDAGQLLRLFAEDSENLMAGAHPFTVPFVGLKEFDPDLPQVRRLRPAGRSDVSHTQDRCNVQAGHSSLPEERLRVQRNSEQPFFDFFGV